MGRLLHTAHSHAKKFSVCLHRDLISLSKLSGLGKRAQQEARKRGGIISSKNLGEKALKPKICPGDKRVLIDQKRKRT